MTKLIETMPVQIPSGSHLSSCGSRALVIQGRIAMSGIAGGEGSLVRDRHDVAVFRGYATTQTFAGPPAWRPPTS